MKEIEPACCCTVLSIFYSSSIIRTSSSSGSGRATKHTVHSEAHLEPLYNSRMHAHIAYTYSRKQQASMAFTILRTHSINVYDQRFTIDGHHVLSDVALMCMSCLTHVRLIAWINCSATTSSCNNAKTAKAKTHMHVKRQKTAILLCVYSVYWCTSHYS
jgi:hypothetical protein